MIKLTCKVKSGHGFGNISKINGNEFIEMLIINAMFFFLHVIN